MKFLLSAFLGVKEREACIKDFFFLKFCFYFVIIDKLNSSEERWKHLTTENEIMEINFGSEALLRQNAAFQIVLLIVS